MEYFETKVVASPVGYELLVPLLDSFGITELQIDDPRDILEISQQKQTYEWDYIDEALLDFGGASRQNELNLSFYLPVNQENQRRLQEIKIEIMKLKGLELDGKLPQGADLGRMYVETTVRDESTWVDVWKAYYHPVQLTETLTIVPSWEYDEKQQESGKVIVLDPGMAFGTGGHETTRLSGVLLERSMKHGDTVLDVGCGSGILSIAAVLLGAKIVYAVEIDEVALAVAKENIAQNGCLDQVTLLRGDLLQDVTEKADVIVANLMADLVIRLADQAKKNLRPQGTMIVSGILLEKEDEVKAALVAAGFQIQETLREGEWCAIRMK